MPAMRALLAQLEQRCGWRSLTVDGHACAQEWRWLDTQADGPATILLPGAVGDGAMFVRTLLALGERMRLIAVTYPALSDPAQLADGLAAVVEHLGLPPGRVAGSSFSAYWLQFYGLRHPQNVTSLVLGNGFVDGTDLAAHPMFERQFVESISAQDLHAQWLARVRATPNAPLQRLHEIMLAERQSPVNLQARFLGVVRSQICPPLPLPDTAITVLDCDDDPLIAPRVRERLRRQYPGARHISLPSGGHYPHVLNPRAYEALLTPPA
ncbi:alpha/beta hydrolase [Verminephrobacter eiseniae]|uniref:alpha/beta fold hydrolase n=1 Tax=Verminephrobacter eiseniae TaxID=364317 RepID=UPI002238299A|nr:alpha/beta hydrolase [Verminephrobacter eiseniae]MCW5260179.1 alpha/beta hydrolase [Verminephrobacter eiseniae]